MANTSLPDLAARTATADTDLIHVNSGGSDYKQTKANFTSDLAKHVTWNTSSTLVSQIGSLPSGSFYGLIASYGHQTETGMPENANFFVTVQRHNASNTDVVAITRGTKPHVWRLGSDNTWIQDPTRDEISALNNSLTNSFLIGSKTDTVSSIANFRLGGNTSEILVMVAWVTGANVFCIPFTDAQGSWYVKVASWNSSAWTPTTGGQITVNYLYKKVS